MQKRDDSKMILAMVLIAAGVVWLLRQTTHLHFFDYTYLHQFIVPFRQTFSVIANTFFSWQMILLITGIVLIAGRRSAGIILVVLGAVFLLPEILHFCFWSLSFLIPALLVGAGIVMILNTARKIN